MRTSNLISDFTVAACQTPSSKVIDIWLQSLCSLLSAPLLKRAPMFAAVSEIRVRRGEEVEREVRLAPSLEEQLERTDVKKEKLPFPRVTDKAS